MFTFTNYPAFNQIEAATRAAQRDNDFCRAFGSRLVVMPYAGRNGVVSFCILERGQ